MFVISLRSIFPLFIKTCDEEIRLESVVLTTEQLTLRFYLKFFLCRICSEIRKSLVWEEMSVKVEFIESNYIEQDFSKNESIKVVRFQQKRGRPKNLKGGK